MISKVFEGLINFFSIAYNLHPHTVTLAMITFLVKLIGTINEVYV